MTESTPVYALPRVGAHWPDAIERPAAPRWNQGKSAEILDLYVALANVMAAGQAAFDALDRYAELYRLMGATCQPMARDALTRWRTAADQLNRALTADLDEEML